MIKILKYLTLREWLMSFISLGFIVAQVWLDLRLPDYMSEITRLTQTPGSAMRDVWINGGFMLLCALSSVVASVIVGYFASRIGAGFSQRLRSLLFNKVESFSMEEISRFSTSSLITRSTNDVTHVQMFITLALQIAIKSPIMAVWAITKIAGKGMEWSMVTTVAVLAIILLVSVLLVFVMPKFKMMQALTDNITRVTRENLLGLRVVRAYNAEGYQEEKTLAANDELTQTQLYTNRALVVLMPFMQTLMSGMSLAIYWIGAYLIDAADLTGRLEIFSNMVVFSQYSVMVIMSFMMLIFIFVLMPRASVAASRIHEILDTEPMITDGGVTESLDGHDGEICFKSVSFKYPKGSEAVLHQIDFEVKKGETVAFIGSTGSGKSTLVQLILRFFDTSSGQVFVGGVNVKDYKLSSLLAKIGYVPQQAVLFKGNIRDNICFGDTGRGYVPVETAAQTALADEFIERLEYGYDSPLSQGGTNVSGGQKQRLSIARAIARQPEILIFDDSFSALDYKTDRLVRHNLRTAAKEATVIIVAQRIGTIMDADQIIVLDEGRIVGTGTHLELLASCSVYQEIAKSQLSEEELR
ncbi:MAG: ABC transporter ATP-binding protein/permease [Turicibacter sp.]|nr:ABC transporter ATP-binding protein/permease [Turicibacter sp.]